MGSGNCDVPLLINAAYFLGSINELNLYVLVCDVVQNVILGEKNKS